MSILIISCFLILSILTFFEKLTFLQDLRDFTNLQILQSQYESMEAPNDLQSHWPFANQTSVQLANDVGLAWRLGIDLDELIADYSAIS